MHPAYLNPKAKTLVRQAGREVYLTLQLSQFLQLSHFCKCLDQQYAPTQVKEAGRSLWVS